MRQSFTFIAAGLSLLAAAACSDVATSPSSSDARSLAAAAPAFDYTGGGRFHFGDGQTSFTVTPDGGSFAINQLLTVAFPAGAICDPAQSTYGPGEWDNGCVTLTGPVTITATTRLTAHGMAVDFQPNLRFAPDRIVTLSTSLFAPALRVNRRFFAAHPSTLRTLAFDYSAALGAEPVADYIADPSLITHVDLQTGVVWRRIKHFSGYVGGAGDSCNPSPSDPDCVAVSP